MCIVIWSIKKDNRIHWSFSIRCTHSFLVVSNKALKAKVVHLSQTNAACVQTLVQEKVLLCGTNKSKWKKEQ